MPWSWQIEGTELVTRGVYHHDRFALELDEGPEVSLQLPSLLDGCRVTIRAEPADDDKMPQPISA